METTTRRTALDYVEAYRRLGFITIPVDKGTKIAAVKWAEFNTGKLTREEVNDRLDGFDYAGKDVGIVTGKASGIIVLDEDEKGALDGQEMPVGTPEVKTGRGRHLYFRYPSGLEHVKTETHLIPGVDMKGDGGLVIAPPSKDKYWMVPLPESIEEVPPCPEWLRLILDPPAIDYGMLGEIIKVLMREPRDPMEVLKAACDTAQRLYGVEPDQEILSRVIDRRFEWQYTARAGGTRMDQIESKKVEWLWPDRIPKGKITILDGDPGLGKSVITADLAARVTQGYPFPPREKPWYGAPEDEERNGQGVLRPGDVATWRCGDLEEGKGVILFSAEDDLGDTIRPRLEAAGADLTKVTAFTMKADDTLYSIPRDVPILEETIRQTNAALVIIDPIMAFLSGRANSDQEVRQNLAALKRLAEETGVAILLIRHLNKKGDTAALYRGGGSIGLIGLARSGLIVNRHPEDKDKCVLAVNKANLARRGDAIGYEIVTAQNEAAVIKWGDAVDMTADDLMKPNDGPIIKAKGFIQEMLENGSVPAKDMYAGARERDITDRTLERAKKEMSVLSKQIGGQWEWSL